MSCVCTSCTRVFKRGDAGFLGSCRKTVANIARNRGGLFVRCFSSEDLQGFQREELYMQLFSGKSWSNSLEVSSAQKTHTLSWSSWVKMSTLWKPLKTFCFFSRSIIFSNIKDIHAFTQRDVWCGFSSRPHFIQGETWQPEKSPICLFSGKQMQQYLSRRFNFSRCLTLVSSPETFHTIPSSSCSWITSTSWTNSSHCESVLGQFMNHNSFPFGSLT